jgi:hypothetical protein
MLNLYWKTKEQTRNLIPKPFNTEAEFEKYIYENQDLLGDIFILHRQIRTGNKQGIPDMIGVDQDSRICIIEMKNTEVSEDILPQVLGYAMWAETNPDSIKAIWLEAKSRPEDISIEWDNLEIRVIVVAPGFRQNVLRMAGKVGYPIDLVQVQRFSFENDEFLLIEVLSEQPTVKVVSTKVMGNWDWDYYEQEHGKDATAQFQKAVEAVEIFVKRQTWDLPYNLNKGYVGFKLGNRVVFGIHWAGTHAWNIRMKLPQEMAEKFDSPGWEFQRYDLGFHEALFRPKDRRSTSDINELSPMFLAAYRYVAGSN